VIYAADPIDAVLVRKVNRFLCVIDLKGRRHEAHIPNSGRLAELMTPGRKAIVERADNPERKTRFTLRSVRYNGRWVCIDANVPNALAATMIRAGFVPELSGYPVIKREYTLGNHRFDLLLDGGRRKPALVEVKSVTLVEGGVARFPDAPTARGVAHLETLAKLAGGAYRCAALFVIQRSDAVRFEPNVATDPAFARALAGTAKAGVRVIAVTCRVGRRWLAPMARAPVSLDQAPPP